MGIGNAPKGYCPILCDEVVLVVETQLLEIFAARFSFSFRNDSKRIFGGRVTETSGVSCTYCNAHVKSRHRSVISNVPGKLSNR